jgi:hypothetical protein
MNFYKNLVKYENKLLRLNEQFGGCRLLLFPLEILKVIDYQTLKISQSLHNYNVIISDGKTKECWDKNKVLGKTYIFNGIKTLLTNLKIYVHPSVIKALEELNNKRKEENI